MRNPFRRPGLLRRVTPAASRVGSLGTLVSTSRPQPRVVRLDDDAFLVRRPARRRRRLRVQRLGEDTWLLRRPGPRARKVQRVGPARLGTELLVDPRVLRDSNQMATHQLKVLHHVAEEHVGWVLRQMEVNCVLDVGANRGQYAKRLRRAGYQGRIVSFEPVPAVAEILEKAAANDPDWQVQRLALGDVPDTMEMEVAGGQARMSSLRPPSEFGKSWTSKLGEMGTTQVSIVRLEDLFDELVAGIDDPRVYLKLDTQGYDLQAFAGAQGCLDRVVGMQSEVSALPIYEGVPRLTEQLAVYEDAGFELTGMFPVIMDKPTMRVIEFDAVMVRVSAQRHQA